VVAVTKHYCCTWRFNGYHEAEAYLTEIFGKKLMKFVTPRYRCYMVSTCGKLQSFFCKIEIWRMCIERNVTDCFPT
jgi:hypothetical protein